VALVCMGAAGGTDATVAVICKGGDGRAGAIGSAMAAGGVAMDDAVVLVRTGAAGGAADAIDGAARTAEAGTAGGALGGDAFGTTVDEGGTTARAGDIGSGAFTDALRTEGGWAGMGRNGATGILTVTFVGVAEVVDGGTACID